MVASLAIYCGSIELVSRLLLVCKEVLYYISYIFFTVNTPKS